MNKITKKAQEFSDEDAGLEWLKNLVYPDGINCTVCHRITKHHKVTNRRCYVCNNCGKQVYPAAGTLFQKSTTPLRTWFEVISKMHHTKGRLTAKEIQREYGLTYKTAWRMVHKIKELLRGNEFASFPAIIKKEASFQDAQSENHGEDLKEKMLATLIPKNTVINAAHRQPFIQPTESYRKPEEHLKNVFRKRDRTAGLLKLQMLLYQNSQGLSIDEIALRCSISKRTVYRDLQVLERELNIPVWGEGSRRGIGEGYFLPPVNFTLSEATIIFFTARLIQNYAYLPHPSMISTFMKLNSIVPVPLRRQIQNILDHIEKLPKNEYKIKKFNTLVDAWLSQHTVKIRYQYLSEDAPTESLIDPYFIETSMIGGSIFVIAFCHTRMRICAFKLERISGEVILQPDTFKIPGDFDAMSLLDEAWGIHFNDPIKTVKLHFIPKMSGLLQETRLHASQSSQIQSDGSTIVTLKVRDNNEFRNWIIGFGDQVEVLEPPELRTQICDLGKLLMTVYAQPRSEWPV